MGVGLESHSPADGFGAVTDLPFGGDSTADGAPPGAAQDGGQALPGDGAAEAPPVSVDDAGGGWPTDAGAAPGPDAGSAPDAGTAGGEGGPDAGAPGADAGPPPSNSVVSGDDPLQRVAVGPDDACAVRADGVTACWGYDGNGERGDGNSVTDPQALPTRVVQSDTGPLRGVDMGYIHVCALGLDGLAYCWGDSRDGQLGDGTRTGKRVPTAVAGGRSYASLSVGSYHACALESGGQLYCWGRNDVGQLGLGTTSARQLTPALAAGSLSVAWVSAGQRHTCAVDDRGYAHCWGENGDGQLGTGNTRDYSVPVPVRTSETFRALHAGSTFTCGLTTDGRALCWGSGGEGQLGDGQQTSSTTPVAVAGGLRFSALTVAGEDAPGFAPAEHACALTSAGDAYCWGSNEYGQLGTGDAGLARALTPWPVDQRACGPFTQIAAGFGFTCALDVNDGVWCWGFDGTGELGQGAGRQDSQVPLRVSFP